MATLIIPVLAGSILTILVTHFLKKRAKFGYSVNHGRVGIAADDSTFGAVRVTWQGNTVSNLYVSTIELKNYSLNDFENVTVKAYTENSHLLTEKAEIIGTTQTIQWDDEFSKSLIKDSEGKYSEQQKTKYYSQRIYTVPVINRGQVIKFTFLSSANDVNATPFISIDLNHKGIKLKYDIAQNEIFGVSQSAAALIGFAFSIATLLTALSHYEVGYLAPVLSFLFGTFAILPGVYLIKAYTRARDFLGN